MKQQHDGSDTPTSKPTIYRWEDRVFDYAEDEKADAERKAAERRFLDAVRQIG